jgi:CubicO group peptidase (beta-lactamase class C family)/D-alanyl-D-alanine dipeptidase
MNVKRIAAAFLVASPIIGAPCQAYAAAQHAPAAKVDYSAVGALLKSVADREVAEKHIPSLSYAIVDADGIRLSGSAGFADREQTKRPTADSVYRVGSISKLFTDIIVMQLVEQGKLDLDAPVTRYLPSFHPHNPYGVPITLRQLMTHRSGLVREPIVGNYFDPTEPSLAATVDSINRTTLVARPGTLTKYSNGGLAVVGRVLEVVLGKPFEQIARERILDPLQMRSSGFSRKTAPPAVYSEMSSYDGPRFESPTFDLGTPSAGSLYTTPNDLAKFVNALLDRSGSKLVTDATLQEMWRPQNGTTIPRTFGLGFLVKDLDGHKTVGHTGGIYGFTTNLLVLPSDGFAVLAFGALDDNPLTRRFGEYAARVMLAAQAGQPLPAFEQSNAIDGAAAARLDGQYTRDGNAVLIKSFNGRTYLEGGGQAAELRNAAGKLVLDDANAYDAAVEADPAGQWISLDGTRYDRNDAGIPPDASPAVKSVIGEYGWDHELIRIFEKDGKPWLRIEWTDWEQMRVVDANHWAFPSETAGLYPKEGITFLRGKDGRATAISLNGIIFKRRDIGKETLAKVRAIVRKVPNLRRDALAAQPPSEQGKQPADLVELKSIDPSLILDIRYATSSNFMGFPLYEQPRAFLERPAAYAVKRVDDALRAKGYGLTIHDGYRPWFVTKMFWDATPPEGHLYVADPSQGSRHNRGAAVDLSMHDLATGKLVEMPGSYDEMSNRSFPQYLGGTSRQRWLRDLLRTSMTAEGFDVYEAEWWHFDFQGWQRYPILNLPFAHAASE